jgi:hypothetical protein
VAWWNITHQTWVCATDLRYALFKSQNFFSLKVNFLLHN